MVSIGSRCRFVSVGLLAAALTAFATSTAQADLFVGSDTYGTVLQYDEKTGDFLADFVGGNVNTARGVLWGPDGNLYAASNGRNNVQRFDPNGNFIDIFVKSGPELNQPRGILRYDPAGNFIDVFVQPGASPLGDPNGVIFGPDGNLYVGDLTNGGVQQYDGRTGDWLGQFADSFFSGNVTYIAFTNTNPT